MNELIIIGGPTASGKSELACLVAERLNGEIVSADSMTVYRGMNIGTAKPRECMDRIKHHLIDIVDPGDYFDAKLFEKLAVEAIKDIWLAGKVPIVVGGTYLYIQALLYGIEETPEPNWRLRDRLYSLAERKGKMFLYGKLKVVDPKYAQKIHPNDLRRIVRALEVFIETGRSFSTYHSWGKARFEHTGFYITRSWESLSKRIEERVKQMIKNGLLDEVKRLIEMGFENFITSQQAIGYKELIPYLKGEADLQKAIDEIVKNTKEYAKRQIRWFRKQDWTEINLDEISIEEACDRIVRIAGKTP